MKDSSELEFEIKLNDLRFFAYHGLLPHEKEYGNEFIVNLSVIIPFIEGVEKDDLDKSVSYADLYGIIEEEFARPQNLLESVAYKIYRRIKDLSPLIKSGIISIEKVHPPIPSIIGSASVSLKF